MGELESLGETIKKIDLPTSDRPTQPQPELLPSRDPEARRYIPRPDTCLGEGCLGAWGIRYVPDGEGGGVPVFDQYCDCPTGKHAQSEDDRVRLAYRNGLRRARIDRYFGSTRVPSRYTFATFETYPVTAETAPVVERLKGYAASCGERTGRSQLLWGDYGIGKTGLAVSTLRAAMELHGIDAYFCTVPELLSEIRSGFRGGRLPYADDSQQTAVPSAGEVQRMVRDTTLLILDDIGAERVTDWVADTLFTLINHRHNHRLRTIFTSNLSTERLAGHLGERLAWRIFEMCEGDVIKLEGPNLRVEKAPR